MALSKGQSTERNGDGRPINLPGKYVHKESGATLITSAGDEGVVQADALMQPRWAGAWHRASDVPSRQEVLAMQKAQAMKDAKETAIEKDADKAEIDKAVALAK